MKLTVLILTIMSFASSALAERHPSSCRILDNTLSKAPPTDVGLGLVSTRAFAQTLLSEGYRFKAREFVDCKDGRKLTVVYIDNQWSEEALGFNAGPKEVVFESELNAGASDLEEIAEIASRHDLPIRESVLEREQCGCAIFYPELKGHKQAAHVPAGKLPLLNPEADLDRFDAMLKAGDVGPSGNKKLTDIPDRELPLPDFVDRKMASIVFANGVVSVYVPPSLSVTRILRYPYRDFKDCKGDTAIRVNYASGIQKTEYDRIYGGQGARKFEKILASIDTHDALNIEYFLNLAKQNGLRADHIKYDRTEIDCDQL